MRNAFVVFGLLCGGVGTALGQPAKPAPPAAPPPLLAEGQLQQVRGHLGQILQFTFEGTSLRLDRKRWGAPPANDPIRPGVVPASPVETLFRQIQVAAAMNSSGMSIGGRDRTITFTGRNLHGRLELRGDSIRVILEEAQAPGRSVEVTEDGEGGLRMQVVHPDGDLILVNQGRKGAVTVVAMASGQVFTGQAESFVALLRKHRDKMDTLVFPALAHYGIQPTPPIQTPQVRRAVLAQVLRTPASVAEGRKLLASLDSQKFDERERAMKKLSAQFENYKDLIEEQLRDKTLSLEVQNRLQKVVAEHADLVQVSQIVSALELTKDASFLVSLFDHVSVEDRSRLVEHLEKTTGQKLGSDPATWKEWAKKRK